MADPSSGIRMGERVCHIPSIDQSDVDGSILVLGGMKCAGQKRAIKRCLFTNSLWGISLIIFIWQFILLSDESRNLPLALFSQLYIQGFIWMGTKISGLFFDVDHGTVIHILAYISMLGVFLLGAAYQKLHERKI